MTQQSPQWKTITNRKELDQAIESSKNKPVLVFKHKPSSPESIDKKAELDATWSLPTDIVDLYLIDDSKSSEMSKRISDLAGIQHESPQIVLFADGVTMYDESHEMISTKKIKLALKIVNRTFKWMETRA